MQSTALDVFALDTAALDWLAGWCVWSLSHNLGHRWWHADMKKGRTTFYAHGEREHHRIYDAHRDSEFHSAEDPRELFISFPFLVVAPAALIFVAAYGWLVGWDHVWIFAAAMYLCMLLDHRLHILFHKYKQLPGILGKLQEMHRAHHATHDRNFFFVSGVVWDALFRTVAFPARRRRPANPGPTAISR
jgi:hypothetical protein